MEGAGLDVDLHGDFAALRAFLADAGDAVGQAEYFGHCFSFFLSNIKLSYELCINN
jgi:hypothetical protein